MLYAYANEITGDADGVEAICVSRFRKSYVLVVVMRQEPAFVKLIWLTNGELARKEYVAELVPSEIVPIREAASKLFVATVWRTPPNKVTKLVRRSSVLYPFVTAHPFKGPLVYASIRTLSGIVEGEGRHRGAVGDAGLAAQAVVRIAHRRRGPVAVYEVPRESRAAQHTAAQRLARRQHRSVALMAALKARLVAMRQQITPGTQLAKACDYALGQWSQLEVHLQNGWWRSTTTGAKVAWRPLTLGRKNWLHRGSAEAGPKVAAIALIIETCRRLDIHLREYLTEVLPKLGGWHNNRVAEMTPTAWKAAKAKQN